MMFDKCYLTYTSWTANCWENATLLQNTFYSEIILQGPLAEPGDEQSSERLELKVKEV